MNPDENKICHFIAMHPKTENYLNNMVRHLKISKSKATDALKSLQKSGIIISEGKIERKKLYSINPDQRGLVEAHYTNLFLNLKNFEKVMNEDLDKIKNKSLFIRKEKWYIWEYKNKQIEKVFVRTFQIIDSIFGAVGSLPFLQIAGFIEKDKENNDRIQKGQRQAYAIIDKIVRRLKDEHKEDSDIIDTLIFLNVKLVAEIMSIEGKTA